MTLPKVGDTVLFYHERMFNGAVAATVLKVSPGVDGDRVDVSVDSVVYKDIPFVQAVGEFDDGDCATFYPAAEGRP